MVWCRFWFWLAVNEASGAIAGVGGSRRECFGKDPVRAVPEDGGEGFRIGGGINAITLQGCAE